MIGGGDKSTQEIDIAKALRPNSKPRFDTIAKVCKALGVKLHVEPVLTH